MTDELNHDTIPLGAAAVASAKGTEALVDNLRERVLQLEEQSRQIKFSVKIGEYALFGMVFVLFMAFLGFAYDYWQFHSSSHQALVEAIHQQNDQTSTCTEVIQSLPKSP